MSSSASKEKDARAFGATDFLDTSDMGAVKARRRTLDYILSTVNVEQPWAEYLRMLRPDSTLCFVGAAPALNVRPGELTSGRKSMVGSFIGGAPMMAEMLEFAAAHAVAPRIEAMPMPQVNAALAKVAANTARYRMVLENPA